MTEPEIVRFSTGTLVQMEAYREALAEAGIDSKIVGDDLETGFGSAMPDSIELWVKSSDVEKARAAVDLLTKKVQ